MKIITFYSDSHYEIYKDYFLPSYEKYLYNHKLISKKIEQISPTGEYESLGFDYAMLEKINLIIDNIDINDDSILVYADCDTQFFNDIKVDIGDYDILFQNDFNSNCAGFFIAKQNKIVLDFFIDVKERFIRSMNGTIHDQVIINILLSEGYDIKNGLLPSNEFWTVAFSTNGHHWKGQDIIVPNEIIMHHANFTLGIESKIKLLKLVKNKKNI